MPTNFDAAWAAANAACDNAFGEAILVAPRAAPGVDFNARRVSDASRAPFSTIGIHFSPADARRPEGRGMTNTNVHHVSAGRDTLTISRAIPWHPRKGDLVTLTGRTPMLEFEIVEVHKHEGATTVMEMTPI